MRMELSTAAVDANHLALKMWANDFNPEAGPADSYYKAPGNAPPTS
jgi:hypothetical protein